jgi:plastocyanin
MTSRNIIRIRTYSIFLAAAVVLVVTLNSNNIAINLALGQKQQHQTKASIVPGASTLANKAFSPNPINTKVGDTITWTNDDANFHTVTSGTGTTDANKGKQFDSGLSGPNALTTKGKTFSHKFEKAGEFPYFCELHPTMIGKVVVAS